MGKRVQAALKTAGKKARITGKQRAARKVNIEVARRAKKSGQKGSSKGAGGKLDATHIASIKARKSSLGGPKGLTKSQKSQLNRDLMNLDRPRSATPSGSAAAKRYDAYAKKGWVKATKMPSGKGKRTLYDLTDKGFSAHNKMFYE